MNSVFAAGMLAAMALASPANAATIEVISGDLRSFTPSAAGGTFGQSFTAIDTNLTSFGFQFNALNPGTAAAPFVFTMRSGAGLTGAIIATRMFTVPSAINTRTPIWFDFDITGALVDIGQVYTAVLTGGSARNGVVMGPNINIYTGQELSGDAYADGQAFFAREVYSNCARTGNCDLNFRVTGTTATGAVPEPATWAMMLAGFVALGFTLRRQRGQVARGRFV